MAEHPLVTEAKKWAGQREIPGLKSNPWILALWFKSDPWLAGTEPADDGKTPWCGAFVRFVVTACGYKPVGKWWSAREWLNWGVPVSFPVPGALVIYGRKGGAHVTICAGQNAAGDLLCWGGNQGDAVTLAAFPRSREPLGYRLPPGSVLPALATLPMLAIAGGATTSTREA